MPHTRAARIRNSALTVASDTHQLVLYLLGFGKATHTRTHTHTHSQRELMGGEPFGTQWSHGRFWAPGEPKGPWEAALGNPRVYQNYICCSGNKSLVFGHHRENEKIMKKQWTNKILSFWLNILSRGSFCETKDAGGHHRQVPSLWENKKQGIKHDHFFYHFSWK